MNILFFCAFALLSQGLFAENHSHPFSSSSSSSSSNCCFKCTLGSVGFTTNHPANWYVLETEPYPVTVLLSKNANYGSTQGDMRKTSTGLKINESGNYSVSFSAILTNTDPTYTPLIPVFVVRNGVFKPNDTTNLGGVVSLPISLVGTVQGTGILQDVKAGTILSLVATNGGSPEPQPVTVLSWSISAFKIPCES